MKRILQWSFLLAIAFSSCKKEQNSLSADKVTEQKANWDETAKSVAKDVSEKLNSVHFRKMLKHEVTLRFDGDANILLSSIIKRLPKYLAHEANYNTASRSSSDELLLSLYNWDIIANASETFPQMQIAVQTDAEGWDPNSFTPSVVYLTSEFDEASMLNINGYDRNQDYISVSTETDPDVNYVVISQNERTTIRDGEVRLTSTNCLVEEIIETAPYNPEANAAEMTPQDCGGESGVGDGTNGTGNGGGTGNPSYTQYIGIGQDGVLPTLIDRQIGTIVPSPTNNSFNRLAPVGTFNGTTVYRKDYKHEKMRNIRCDDIGKIEGWPAGAPEIRLVVLAQNVLNPSENLQIFKEEFEPSRRRHINDTWWDAEGVTMHLWDYAGTGTKATFAYYEYDPVLVPNESLQEIGAITVDILAITNIIPTGNPTQVGIYGSIGQSVATGIRYLKKKNGMSEYIGKDDYSIFNDEDQYNHSPGGTKFKTWPDL